jgi:hypothetical protein
VIVCKGFCCTSNLNIVSVRMVVLDIRDIRSQFAVWAFTDSMQRILSLKANCFSVVIDGGTPLIITVFIIPLTGLHSVPGESSLRPPVSSFV